MPRTFNITFTPAWLARYRARQTSGSCSELTLAMIKPGRSGEEAWISRSIRSMNFCRSPIGATASFDQPTASEEPVKRLKKAAVSAAISRSQVIRPTSEYCRAVRSL